MSVRSNLAQKGRTEQALQTREDLLIANTNLILFNKKIIIAGICSFFSAAFVTQKYYEHYNKRNFANSTSATSRNINWIVFTPGYFSFSSQFLHLGTQPYIASMLPNSIDNFFCGNQSSSH